ncbi:propionate catabolism operon regulatory protein PrpR [Anaeromyxobacter sp. SG66]|uniref:propionate catabolism operon regulatory protein PrpR n=1 Tax=Anaeromyxobacter sp. SG66 TaxID=2925410 RepID=UPI001F5ACB8B|nr:propionate catabolism operon regulatory protein PrpR [Anaeromyxobacter sp. SG66]
MAADADRRPIVWAFSTSRLRHVFESVAPLLANVAEVRVFDKGFEEALQVARSHVEAGEEVDAFVAAGANGAYLRDHADVPVVVVMASTVDALQALVQARKLSNRIGVVNFRRVVAGIEQSAGLMSDLVIEQRPYVTPEDVKAHVADLAAQGFGVIVGPGPVCDFAERQGLPAVLLYGQDSLSEAIRHAAEVARIARAAEAKRLEVERVLRHLDLGVLAVDGDERIQSLNPALQRVLGVTSAEVTGRRLSAIAPELSLARVLETGTPELDVVQRLGGRTLVVSRLPLREAGVQRGALLTCQDSAAIQRLERGLRSEHRPPRFVARFDLAGILGTSPAIARVRALAERYARSDATVLITGESGTGKEMVAQGIHRASRRRDRPFVAVNCAAFPETLLEAELFGHEEGAFTGARRGGRPGLFEAAHTGTIFLDEIGDVPTTLQTRLLRVLQERQVLRLGSNDPTPVDVRVIAATHRDLRGAVGRGEFREDLFYRLAILPLHIPPLRERGDDVQEIASDLLKRALLRHGEPDAHRRALALVLPRLAGYGWPGNVRELENVLERVAALFVDRGPRTRIPEEELRAAMPEVFEHPVPAPAASSADLRAARDALERAHVERVLAECGGNQTEAARRLGIGRTTLYRKLGRA